MGIETIDAGTLGSWTIQVVDAATGQPATGYTPDIALAATLWTGDDQSPLSPAPVAEWLNAGAGTVTLTIPGEVTSGLEPGIYRLRLSVVDAGQTQPVYETGLQVRSSPGSATPAPIYGSAADLHTYAPWLDQLQDLPSAQAGFREQRARARSWLEDLLHSRYRGGSCVGIGNPRGWGWGYRAGQGRSPWLVAELAADHLLVTDRVREICARKAIALVCESQIGPDPKNPYVALAARYHAQASSLATCLVAEVDTDGDGVADVVISLGDFRVLRG